MRRKQPSSEKARHSAAPSASGESSEAAPSQAAVSEPSPNIPNEQAVTPWPVKLRVTAALAVGIVTFLAITWSVSHPALPGHPLLLWEHDSPALLAGLALLGAVVSGTTGALVSGRDLAAGAGMVAVAAAASLWAVTNGTLETILLTTPGIEARQAFFRGLMTESAVWAVMIVMGCLAAMGVARLVYRGPIQSEPEKGPTRSPNDTRTIGWGRRLGQGIFALLVLTAMSVFLTRLLLRSSDTVISAADPVLVSSLPKMGQMAFAVAVSFYLGMLLVRSFTPNAPLLCYLPGPLLAGLFSYHTIARESVLQIPAATAAGLLPNQALIGTIPPMVWVSVGMLCIVIAYWKTPTMRELLNS